MVGIDGTFGVAGPSSFLVPSEVKLKNTAAESCTDEVQLSIHGFGKLASCVVDTAATFMEDFKLCLLL